MNIIGKYTQIAPVCRQYDHRGAAAANMLITLVHARDPRLIACYVGSSVANCAGKGVIDLLVTYPAGVLPSACTLLQELGFQAQTSRNRFPAERPMGVGSLQHMNRRFLIHAHIVSAQSPEVEEMLWFRERLEMDAQLRTQYVAEKRRILRDGVADSTEYAERKGAFIQAQLQLRKT